VYAALIISVVLGFNLKEAAAIGIIGGADGPTAIYLAVKLAPHLLGPLLWLLTLTCPVFLYLYWNYGSRSY